VAISARVKYAARLAVTSRLLRPMESMVDSEKVAITTNSTAANHITQLFLVNKVTAVMKLKIPTKAKCGAKLEKGNKTKSITPETI
jgi:hypothetical protein